MNFFCSFSRFLGLGGCIFYPSELKRVSKFGPFFENLRPKKITNFIVSLGECTILRNVNVPKLFATIELGFGDCKERGLHFPLDSLSFSLRIFKRF